MATALNVLSLIVASVGAIAAVLVLRRLLRPVGREMEGALRDELRTSREEAARQARELREEVANTQAKANDLLLKTLNTLGDDQRELLAGLTQAARESAESTRMVIEKLVQRTIDALREIQSSTDAKLDAVRKTTEEKLASGEEAQRRGGEDLKKAMTCLTDTTRAEMTAHRDRVQTQLQEIQASNEKKLDEMRQTVDEKLHNTLEKRLGESFKLVSERLEAVQRGLGEMQTLATGVGDLKRVLTNVKERGTWGEYQLGAILEEILTPDQFARNVRPREGGEQVEFAVKLPGKGADADKPVWLPIDAKFPKEDYERLLEAASQADTEQVKAAVKALAGAILKSARDIHDKYIAPPATTDFGVMFLPTEGLYAEVLRQPGLHDELQRKYRVLVAGPTTLSAILSSLRVGFQTLVIEKRAHEVWTVLGAVKTEFGKFGGVLEKVQRQLNTASRTLDESARRSRAMERSLRGVEQLPAEQAAAVLALPDPGAVDVEEEAADEPGDGNP